MKPLKLVLALLLSVSLLTPVMAGKSGSGSSSRPSSSSSSRPSSSSSKPSSSSRPSTPSSSSASKPSSRPNSNSGSTPGYGPRSSDSNLLKTPPSIPRTSSRPNADKQDLSPSYKPSSRPGAESQQIAPAGKPKQSFDGAAATAQNKQESKAAFQASSRPKESYTTPAGTVVKVDPNASSTKTIRSTPPEKIQNRTVRVEHHYHNYYGDRYDYYRSQPYINVGGGYSPLFWYAMMDWDYQRRAQWLYNNQNTINQSLYQEQMQNAQLRAEVERLRNQGTPVNPHYVDPEFTENQDLMYGDDYVQAAYNPAQTSSLPGGSLQGGSLSSEYRPLTPEEQAAHDRAVASFFKWFAIVFGIVVVTFIVVYFVFIKEYEDRR